jgi:hypothetical protein
MRVSSAEKYFKSYRLLDRDVFEMRTLRGSVRRFCSAAGGVNRLGAHPLSGLGPRFVAEELAVQPDTKKAR